MLIVNITIEYASHNKNVCDSIMHYAENRKFVSSKIYVLH